jgi:hypothetical protein
MMFHRSTALLLVTGFVITSACAQSTDKIINAPAAEKIIRVLAADEMRGRKVFTPEIDKAADYIAAQFKEAGLQPGSGSSYLQAFSMVSPKQESLNAAIDGQAYDAKKILVLTSTADLTVTDQSGYEQRTIAAGDVLFEAVMAASTADKNLVVWVDESFANTFPRLSFLKRTLFKSDKSVIFVLGKKAERFSFSAKHSIEEKRLANVVGILPGKKRKDEYVIFSGHYDHIGVSSREAINGDSIFNGANDDAAGITAVILLARYYKVLGNNDRTIIFAAFTAEEVGGYGSQYFSKQFNPDKVMAMFNIEMIGTESKWGRNSAYITGYEKSDMGKILQANLTGTGFEFHPDPYTDQQLFYRSDNATLARLGVPAHTISTAKMENEPNYHKVTDHVETLDMENMAKIINSIALSARSIVAGKDTPSRVKEK